MKDEDRMGDDFKTFERLAILETQIKTMENKLDDLRVDIKDTIKLSLAPLCSDTDSITKKIEELEKRVKYLEELPAKKTESTLSKLWDKIGLPIILMIVLWLLSGKITFLGK